ncbi:MAG: hypothetical protein HYU52_08755 [Acidobacteria bacterium]|nr:hypothetical protein [Acidobacteriota bacterium]
MSSVQSEVENGRASSGWPEAIQARLKEAGTWPTLNWLFDERTRQPGDIELKGYVEILRAVVVKEFLSHPQGMRAVPKLSPEFLADFGRFNLTAQEGYLISLIDGRTNIEKLLKLSPFDPFSTLFNLARLQSQKAIVVPQ